MDENKDNNKDSCTDEEEYRTRAEAELDAKLEKLNRELFSERDNGESAAALDRGTVSVITEFFPDVTYNRHILRAVSETARVTRAAARAKQNIHGGHRARQREQAYNDRALIGFNDITLLELILSFFVPQRDTNPLAHKLLDKFGSPVGVLQAAPQELLQVSGVTQIASIVIPMLLAVALWHGGPTLALDNPQSVAEILGAMFCRAPYGVTYSVLLDKRYKPISIERNSTDEPVPSRATLSATFKYSTKYVILVRREAQLFPDEFGLNTQVYNFATALDKIGIKFIDFIVYTDGGYYTLGEPPKPGNWYVKYIFVPLRKSLHARRIEDMIKRLGTGMPAEHDYVGRDDAAKHEGVFDELRRFIRSSYDN